MQLVYSQTVAEFIVVGGIAVTLLGLYWRTIIAGCIMLFCFIVLANSENVLPTVKVPPTPQTEVVKIETVKPNTAHIERGSVTVDPKRAEYVHECQRYGFKKIDCENIWDGKDER